MTSFLRLWSIGLAIKLIVSAWLPLSTDEAYYWVWGQNPQLSYYDHPPMVAWLFWIGNWIDFGGQMSRWPAVVLGHATLLIWNRLLEPFLAERERVLWLGFILLSPFLGIGSLIVTPDIPLVFFWSLSILLLLVCLNHGTLLNYSALGAALGLGFCAKYHMVLFVPFALIWLAISGRWRWIQFRFIPTTIIAGLVFCFPVWYWNLTHDWVSFRFQLDHGFKGGTWNPAWPLQYLGGQVALILPPLFILAMRRKEPRSARWLHAFAWLPLGFFLYTSFKARVEANWPILAHPAVLTLAFLNDAGKKWIRGSMVLWAIALIALLVQVAWPWIPMDARRLKTSEMTKYDDLSRATTGLESLFAGSYQMASSLSYGQRRMVPKLAGMNRRDFYDFHAMSIPRSDVFYVAVEGGHPLPDWVIQGGAIVTEWRDIPPDFKILEVKRRAQDSAD